MAADEIVADAITRLRELIPPPVYVVGIRSGRSRGKETGRGDDIIISAGEWKGSFSIQTKRRVTSAAATQFVMKVNRAENRNRAPVVVAEYIQPSAQEVLRRHGVNYIDAAGNCHISQPPIFIHVEGRKPQKVGSREKIRAFGGEGLKVIFALLIEPELISKSYREIAHLSGVSHGVIQYTVSDLEQMNFVIRFGRSRRRIQRNEELLGRWVEGYVEALRPRLSLGRFQFREPNVLKKWQDLDLDPRISRWGGEPAANLMTEYIKPGLLTLYTRASRPEMMKELKILPQEDGPLEIVRMFWPPELERAVPHAFAERTVPEVLVYSDLVASGDPRNLEVAGVLKPKLAL